MHIGKGLVLAGRGLKWVGPTLCSVATGRFAATGLWCASAFALCWWHEASRARVLDGRTEIPSALQPEKAAIGRKNRHRPAMPVYPHGSKRLRAV